MKASFSKQKHLEVDFGDFCKENLLIHLKAVRYNKHEEK